MRCGILSALVSVALAGAALGAQERFGNPRDLNRRGDGITRLQLWVDATESHRGGFPDEATRRIASWTPEELKELTIARCRFARQLLDLVTPRPSRDNAVRDWYRASCAALLGRVHLYADHFEQALRLFPADPVLLLFEGSFHEALSSASVQAFVRSAVPPKGVVFRVGSPRIELGRAEPFYRRALEIDPGAAEARVRLGRVLSLQARHADALNELRRVAESASPILQYYGTLFAGEAAEALGRLNEARAAYERAAELYPRAQAPSLALSQLAMRAGDASRAANTIKNVLSSATEPMLEDDPFWTYYSAAGRDADALLDRAYQTLSAGPER